MLFNKDFKIKNNIQLKGSEVKKLKGRLSVQFKHLTDENLSSLLPSKSSFSSTKLETFDETLIVVYSVDKRPQFFEISGENKLYPTLYALWVVPEIVPYMTTNSAVLPKLARGADLMIPGIIRDGSDLKAYGRFKKDDIVAVNITSNKAAVGVGIFARSSEDLYMSGGHGVGVKMLHVFGDKLWGMEPSVTQQIPLSGPTRAVPTLSNEDFPALGSEKVEKPEDVPAIQNLQIAENPSPENSNEAQEQISSEPTPDEYLVSVFLSSLKSNKKQILNQLPVLVSTFYPNYIQKEINDDKPFNIKETSFKKVSTFFKKMHESGYITVKEENKGIEKITAINYEHPDIVCFIPRKKEKSDNEKVEAAPQLLLTKMTELFVVTEFTKKLFNALGVPVGKSLDQLQIKNYVKDYVCRKKLLNSKTGLVTLDEALREIVAAREEDDVVPYDRLLSIVTDSMDNTYEMRSQTAPQSKGGKKPIIQITTANRSGNKKVTLIENLDAYGINIAEFSKAIKVGVAASTTMTKSVGSNKDQFLVQGNHVKFIYDLLCQQYKIPRNCITGLEFAKKDKKK